MNLFIAAHEARHGSDFDRIGTGWEDTLTELLAFYLRSDEEALQAVVSSLLGDRWENVLSLDTQLQFERDRPDVVIELESGRLLCIESKIAAPLGDRQLERYLRMVGSSRLPSYVALISGRHTRVCEEALASDRYLHPEGRDHWYWQDISRMIPGPRGRFGLDHLRRCFIDYLDLLGLVPTILLDCWQDLLGHDDSARTARIAFGRKLAGVRRWFRERGYQLVGDSQSGFQAKPATRSENEGTRFWLTVNPSVVRRHLMEPEFSHKVESAGLRVALVYDATTPPPEALEVYKRFPRPLVDGSGFQWWPVAPYRMTNRRVRLEVVASLQQLLSDETLIEERLTVGCTAAAQELLDQVAAAKGSD